MPAHERSFSDPLPDRLYLDTDILIAYLFEFEPHHNRCRRFLRRVAESGRTRLFTSSLTWMEFTNAIMKTQFRARLSEEWWRQFRLSRWQDAEVRQHYLGFHLEACESLLSQFSWLEVSFTPEIRAAATRVVSMYNLRAYDAVHVGSASYVGVSDLASLDEAYRSVDGVVLWNDLIHRGGRA
jgi:predicted nucleic acid-binding protein